MSFYYFPPANEESEAHGAPSQAGVKGRGFAQESISIRFYYSDLYILSTLCLLGVSHSVRAMVSISHKGYFLNHIVPASPAASVGRSLLLHSLVGGRSVCACGSHVAAHLTVWNALQFYEYVSSHVRLHLYDFRTP